MYQDITYRMNIINGKKHLLSCISFGLNHPFISLGKREYDTCMTFIFENKNKETINNVHESIQFIMEMNEKIPSFYISIINVYGIIISDLSYIQIDINKYLYFALFSIKKSQHFILMPQILTIVSETDTLEKRLTGILTIMIR